MPVLYEAFGSVITSCNSIEMDLKILYRFLNKIKYEPLEGCWEWTGAIHLGYGRIKINGVNLLAHRISYEYWKGTIPNNLEIDHLCRNRYCVNPLHLEVVTRQENTIRGISPERNLLKTHCPYGHPYNDENTRKRRGGRECKECGRQRVRERRRKEKYKH